jgi:hypothetical protein
MVWILKNIRLQTDFPAFSFQSAGFLAAVVRILTNERKCCVMKMDETNRNQVVVHTKDGSILKGYTHDFTPLKDNFHLIIEADGQKDKMVDIAVSKLKAIFFVKSLSGNKYFEEKKFFEQVDQSRLRGIKIRVEFQDGEIIRGISLGYNKNKKGFFIIPVDPDSNNDRIYVISDACKNIKVGDFAIV